MKKRKSIMIGILCIMILMMSVAYAAFSVNLNINGTANIASTWDIKFTNITQVSKSSSGVTVISEPTVTGTAATFNISLDSPGDNIVYDITVANQGTLDAIVSDIIASESVNGAIKFNITGMKKGDLLNKNSTKKITVTISYDSNVTSQPNITTNSLTLNMTFIQNVGQNIPSENINIVTLPIASEKCFGFDKATGTITAYYRNEENISSNPTCPKALTIPNKIEAVVVMAIREWAFAWKDLTGVVIPSSITFLGQGAFNYNRLSDDEAFIYARNSDGSEDKTYLVSYGGIVANVVIPDGVTRVGSNSFAYCSFIKSVIIPGSVTTIGSHAFADNHLTSVIIPGSVTTIGSNALVGNPLINIINRTTRAFDWQAITGGNQPATFVTGVIPHPNGDITVSAS